MIEIVDKSQCSGCTACVNICPQKCIIMQPDAEGYLYPSVDRKICVECGLCEKTCPINKPLNLRDYETKAFALQHKDIAIRESSASGGAFTAIASAVLKKGGVVFGGSYGKRFKVEHNYITTMEDLSLLRGSKYVQSDVQQAFQQVKLFLKKDRWVCFSGTPCQVNGLRSYLRMDYEKLILVDLVCHGIPSPKLWTKFIDYVSEHNGSNLEYVSFRDKYYGYSGSTMALGYSDGKTYYNNRWVQFYKHTFFADLNTRPSCFKCHFKTVKRESDFTLYDCWHIGNYDKSMDNDRGVTMVLVHSEKAEQLIEEIKSTVKWCEANVEETINTDGRLAVECTKPNPHREQFFKDCEKMEMKELIKKYFPLTMKKRIVMIVKPLFSKIGLIKLLKR